MIVYQRQQAKTELFVWLGRSLTLCHIEPSHPARIASLLMAAYELTEREMMLVPQVMLTNSLALQVDEPTRVVTQWVGFGVFSLAVINYLARNDPGSSALRAVMLGNVIFHVLGIGFDVYDYGSGYMKISGFVSGVIPHLLLVLGFIYYLWELPTPEWRQSKT